MGLRITKPGILTTIQDLGRVGYRGRGINPGGVMDRAATRLINTFVGNDENAAVLEMHFPAPEIEFQKELVFALGGADFSPHLNGKSVANWSVIEAGREDKLTFATKVSGSRAYLAPAGGFRVSEWLGSSSTNLAASIGGHCGRRLTVGDELGINIPKSGPETRRRRSISPGIIPHYRPFPTVRITRGGEFDRLDAVGQRSLVEQDFTISDRSNRMGFQLSGAPMQLATPVEFISSAVTMGTVQILPDGQLIILMADHQTAGGYPRIAHIINRDLPLAAQLGAGDKVAFHLVDQMEAEALALEFERELRMMRVGVAMREF